MQVSYQTDQGQKRKNNQDSVDSFKNQRGIELVLVADGMGGHRAGDVASRMLIGELGNSWEEELLVEPEACLQWLLQHIQTANEKIYEKGQAEPDYFGMGTTVVAVILLADCFVLAHVGDSRCYLLRNEQLRLLTEDHSLVNELLRRGEITEEMAEHHPRKNVLTRSVGMPGVVEVDANSMEALPGDYLLLCSDGLTNMLSEKEINVILLEETSLDEKVTQLIDQANAAGGLDNITVLLIHYSEMNEEVS